MQWFFQVDDVDLFADSHVELVLAADANQQLRLISLGLKTPWDIGVSHGSGIRGVCAVENECG